MQIFKEFKKQGFKKPVEGVANGKSGVELQGLKLVEGMATVP